MTKARGVCFSESRVCSRAGGKQRRARRSSRPTRPIAKEPCAEEFPGPRPILGDHRWNGAPLAALDREPGERRERPREVELSELGGAQVPGHDRVDEDRERRRNDLGQNQRRRVAKDKALGAACVSNWLDASGARRRYLGVCVCVCAGAGAACR